VESDLFLHLLAQGFLDSVFQHEVSQLPLSVREKHAPLSRYRSCSHRTLHRWTFLFLPPFFPPRLQPCTHCFLSSLACASHDSKVSEDAKNRRRRRPRLPCTSLLSPTVPTPSNALASPSRSGSSSIIELNTKADFIIVFILVVVDWFGVR